MAPKTKYSPTVLGLDGNPFKSEIITKEHFVPTVTGVRSPWTTGIANGLDPTKLAALLKSANEGDNHDFLVLAEEMEERDGHYASVLGQRKRAVSGLEPIVVPVSDNPEDQKIADVVEKMIMAPVFADMVDDLLDGLAKGYSVVEVVWDFSESIWMPERYIHRDPRHFQFDTETGRELRLRDDDNQEGVEIAPNIPMLFHQPRLKSGLSVRGGLARIAAWCFMLKSYTLQDWAAFLEVFGMPLRVGKFDDNASAEEKRILLRAVRDLGSDAAAIIPKGMEIEFIEVSGGQGNAVFGAMTEYLDKQMSKAIIGQTMTTDDGSSKSQSETHNEVRGDIKKSDARQMATTVNRDLVSRFITFNFPNKPAPTVVFPVEDPEDIKVLSETLGTLVPLGLRIAKDDVTKRMGFRVPDKNEAVLQAPVTAAPTPTMERASMQGACPSCGEVHLATVQEQIDDPLVSEALGHWEADMSPIVEGLRDLAKKATSYEEFLAMLDAYSPDTTPLEKRLAIQAMKAKGDGLTDG